MTQSRRQAITEVSTNVGIGCVIAWVITWVCFRVTEDSAAAATLSVFVNTLASLLRGYTVRRYFDKKHSAINCTGNGQ